MARRAAGFAILIACGGEVQQAPTRPPPAPVLAMQIRVDSAGGQDNFCPSLEQGLTRSNLTVVPAGTTTADAIVSCRAFASEDTGFFRVEVNGQRKMKYTVRVDVRGASGQAVDSFLAEYNGYQNNPPDEDVVSKVVLGFAYSPRIAAYARGVQRAKASGVVTQPEPTMTASVDARPPPPPPSVDRRDDQTWFAIDTVKCKIPARVEACDVVRRYLQRFPTGSHAQEANEILAAAQPALEKLQKDDVGWQKANHAECARLRSADACVGVEAYTVQFSSGVHADEAHRLLRSAGVEK
ncbi:MAG TPA: hypothetical protein VH054_24870 [Polyangiaceae bacterium]|jgi:hypothetical protein|nr:hypothetical protein [Polyangiaceae bacterium]